MHRSLPSFISADLYSMFIRPWTIRHPRIEPPTQYIPLGLTSLQYAFINFYYTISLQSCFNYCSLLEQNNYNRYMCAIYNYYFFMMNSLLTKFYNKYAIIYV